jgi:hypothetical protein
MQSRKPVKTLVTNTSRPKPLQEPLPLFLQLAQKFVPVPAKVVKEAPELSVLIAFANLLEEKPETSPETFFADCFPMHPELRGLLSQIGVQQLRKETLFGERTQESISAQLYEFASDAREALTLLARMHQGRLIQFPWHLSARWDAKRIRICEACPKLFYATRSNRMTCSEKCSVLRRVREFRKRQPAYAQRRKLKGATQ